MLVLKNYILKSADPRQSGQTADGRTWQTFIFEEIIPEEADRDTPHTLAVDVRELPLMDWCVNNIGKVVNVKVRHFVREYEGRHFNTLETRSIYVNGVKQGVAAAPRAAADPLPPKQPAATANNKPAQPNPFADFAKQQAQKQPAAKQPAQPGGVYYANNIPPADCPY